MRIAARIFFLAIEVTQGPSLSDHYAHIKRTHTNAECFARMPSDIVAVFFGFDCTSMAKNGRRQGLAHSSWQDFDAAVAALKEKQVMAFHCENVADLLTADQFKAEREHVLGSFRDAGYVTIQGVADPAEFGWPCSRRRCHILGLRCDVAERVGWGKQSVITHPFDTTKKRSPRCVADFMAQPRGETLEDDVTDFDVFAARELHVHGRHWYVHGRHRRRP